MLLEGVISSAVNRFLGEYVEGLDSSQLCIHLLRGEMKLENLTIKGEVLNEKLKLPVEIVFGHIGLLHVSWEWMSLKTKPVTIIMSDVNILLREKSIQRATKHGKERVSEEKEANEKEQEDALGNPEKEADLAKKKDPREMELAEKMDRLAAAEAIRLAPDTEKEPGFVTKLIQGVLANLRVFIRHVHIRYEHKLDPRNPCSLGVTLEELRISSATPEWQKVHFVSHDQQFAHKLIEVSGLGVYCNHHQVLWPPTQESMRGVFEHQIVKTQKGQQQEAKSEQDDEDAKKVDPMSLPSLLPRAQRSSYDYLLQLDGTIRATINKAGAPREPDEPAASIQAVFTLVNLSLRRNQFLSLLGVVSDLQEIAQRVYHAPREEPNKTEDEKEKEEEDDAEPHERPGTIDERERYIFLYKRTMSSSWLPELDDDELKEIQQFERDIEYKSLDEWRVYAIAELRAEMPVDAPDSTTPVSTPTDISSGATSSDTTEPSPFATQPIKHTLEKRIRSSDRSFMENVKSKLSTAATVVGSVAVSILPGSITDKLGLTTEQSRAAEAEEEIEQREREECEAPFEPETPEESPEEPDESDNNTPTSDASHTSSEEPTSTPVDSASVSPAPQPLPKVILTDDERAAIRAAAFKAELSPPTTRAHDELFLPTDDRSHDALVVTADVSFDKIALRLMDEHASELFCLTLDRLRARVAQRFDTMAAQVELARLTIEDMRAWGYPYVASTNQITNNKRASEEDDEEPEQDENGEVKVTPPPAAQSPFLLLHVSRLGTVADHALEIDAELNHLQIYLLPSLLQLPAFFELPPTMRKKAADAGEEVKRAADHFQKEQETEATRVDVDSLDMADALITQTADDPSSHPKKPLIPMPPMPIFARFRMNYPLLLMPAEPSADDTRGLVVSWSIDLSACVGGATPGSIQAQVGLNSFSIIESAFALTRGGSPQERVLHFSTKLEPATRPIISPFHIKANLNTEPSSLFRDGQAQNISLDLRMSRLDINLGYRFYQMATVAFNQFTPPPSQNAKADQDDDDDDDEAADGRDDPNAKVIKSIEAHINEGDTDKNVSAIPQDPFAPLIAAQPIMPLHFTEMNASVKLVGIYINVINDAWTTALPFLRLHVENVGLNGHRFGDSGGFTGHIDLRAEAYNHRLLAWEPIIEPWSALLSISQCQVTHTPGAVLLMASADQLARKDSMQQLESHKTSAEPRPHRPLAPLTSINFTSKTPFNVNVSAALLEDLADSYSHLQRQLRRTDDGWRRVPQAKLYRLENHTDLAMHVYRTDLSQLDDAASEPTELMDLLPFSNASFDFADEISIPARALRVQLNSAHGALPILTIPVSREVSSKHVLHPIGGSGSMTVLVDVTWDAGVRVLAIHSAWAVVNKTNLPILVSGDRYVEKELRPNQQIWLPLLMAPMMHTIRVKPADESTRLAYLRQAFIDGTQKESANLDGEYQWSDEIVLTSTQRPTKRKDDGPAMLDHHSCQPAAARQTRSHLEETKENLDLLPVTPTSLLVSHAAYSTTAAVIRPFHFVCFHSGLDVIDDDEMMDGIEVPKTREFHASIFEIRTPITCENVLATDVNVRLLSTKPNVRYRDDAAALKDAMLVQDLTLARGQSCPIFGADTSNRTFLSVQLPELAAGWSIPTLLKFKGDTPTVVLTHLYGDNGGMLPICIELKQQHGNLRVALYTQYWLWDLSSLSLQVSPDQRLILPSRLSSESTRPAAATEKHTQAHLESISLPDQHRAVMFSFDDVDPCKGKLCIRAGRHPRFNGFDLVGPCADTQDPDIQWSQWSEKTSIAAIGNQSAITMPMGPAKSSGAYELVVDVSQGEGQFHRTRMVKFMPRFILLNLLKGQVYIKQFGMSDASHLTLNPTQQIIWHWPQHAPDNHHWLSIKRQPEHAPTSRKPHHRPTSVLHDSDDWQEWQWSGWFTLDPPGDQNILVRHESDSTRVLYINVEVRQRNGINFVMLNEYDAHDTNRLKVVLPYCISNRSSTELIRVRQYLDVSKNGSDSSHFRPADTSTSMGTSVSNRDSPSDGFGWLQVPPLTDLPFCLEEPLVGKSAIQVEVASKDGLMVREWIGASDSNLAQLDIDRFEDDHAFIDYTHTSRSESDLHRLGANLAPAARDRARANPLHHRLYYYNQQDGPSRFLVFSDQPSDKWKKVQLRKRLESHLKEANATSDSVSSRRGSKAMAPSTSSSSGSTSNATLVELIENVSAEEKEHIATVGEKANDITDVTENSFGVHTEEQMGQNTGQHAVDAHMLGYGHGIVVDPVDSSGSAVVLADLVPDGASRGLSFAINASSIEERVRALRVSVGSVQGLRDKYRVVFAKVIFGDQTRQTPAHKRNQEQVDINEDVFFDAQNMGRTKDTAMSHTTCHFAHDRLSSVVPSLLLAGSSASVPLRSSVPTATLEIASRIHEWMTPRLWSVMTPRLYASVGDAATSIDCQHVFIDLYERHTFMPPTLIGSTSINLTNITSDRLRRWYELRKVKGRTAELRGVIQLAIWFDLKEETTMSQPQPSQLQPWDTAHSQPSRVDTLVALESDMQQPVAVASMNPSISNPSSSSSSSQFVVSSSAAPTDSHQPCQTTFKYENASVYASSLQALPSIQHEPPHFQSLASPDYYDAAKHEQMCIEVMAEEAVKKCSWSEYTIRLVDTLNLDRVASALMADLSAGRVVCYVTAPLFRRGYSILLHDRQYKSIEKTWSNQDIIIALPDQLLAERKVDAILRLSFYYFPFSTATVQTKASLRASHSRSSSFAQSALDTDTSGPLLLGTAVIPLLSIYTVKLDALEQKSESDPASGTAPIEDTKDEEVDVAILDDASLDRYRYKKRMERMEKENRSREQLRQSEWDKKWISLGTPGQSTESAEVCLSIHRREVKMPIQQAVSDEDQFASYTPAQIRLKLQLPQVGVSIIDGQPQEVGFFAMQNLSIHLHDSATSHSFKLSLDSFQLDNLLRDAIFPVVLNATSVPPREWMPVLQMAVSRQKLHGTNIQCFPYISILMQMIDVKTSELYLYKILDFINDLNKRVESEPMQQSANEEQRQRVIYRKMSDEFILPSSQLRTIYTKFLHLQPLAVNLTFAANPGVRSKFLGESFAGGGLIGQVLRSAVTIVGAGVGSLDAAPIRLAGKIIEHHLGSPESFMDILISHYVKQGIKQTYAVLGSLEILGNPVGTASQLTRGVTDVLYLPAQGLMVSPEAFGEGLAEGSLSLVRHSLAGLGGAVAGVFSSGGKAAAALTMDSDFITRSSIRNALEPDHVGEGFKLGVISFAHGLKEGVTGIVADPIRGAEEDGAKGLVKGIGRGIIGAFAKPVAGALNMVAQTSKGFANTGDYLSYGPRPHLHHFRPRRFIDPLDGRITIYDKHASQAAIEAEATTASDTKRKAIRRESQKHESDTAILHHQTIDSQPMHIQEEQRKLR